MHLVLRDGRRLIKNSLPLRVSCIQVQYLCTDNIYIHYICKQKGKSGLGSTGGARRPQKGVKAGFVRFEIADAPNVIVNYESYEGSVYYTTI